LEYEHVGVHREGLVGNSLLHVGGCWVQVVWEITWVGVESFE